MSTRKVTIAGKAGSINDHFGKAISSNSNRGGSGSRPARGGAKQGSQVGKQQNGPKSKISKFSKPQQAARGGKGPRGSGRGGRGGRQGGDRKPQKKRTQEDLDKELDAYMMKDEKTAQSRLDADLEDYMNARNKAQAEEAPASTEAGAQ